MKKDDKKIMYENILKHGGQYEIEIHKMYPCKNRTELQKEEQKVE